MPLNHYATHITIENNTCADIGFTFLGTCTRLRITQF